MSERIYIRNWSRTIMGLIVTLAIGGFFAYGAVRDQDRTTVTGVAIVEALVVTLLVRTWLAGVLITDERIAVRNLIRSYSVPWSQVDAFSPAWDDPRHHSCGVNTVDGRRISAMSLRDLAGWSLVAPPRYVENATRNVPATRLSEQVERMLTLYGRVARPGSA